VIDAVIIGVADRRKRVREPWALQEVVSEGHHMGFYARVIFPWACDLIMSAPHLAEARREFLAEVTGEVLEIGFGTGLNLPHYPEHVRKITAIDVNPGMHARAEKRIRASTIAVEHRVINGERLPMPNDSFDSVVSTWTLCSIKNVSRALREIRRVLKPGGRFFFMEHGLSDDPAVQRWQHLLNPLEKLIADGCHLNRNIPELIERQGLRIVKLDRFYMDKTPKTHGYTYRGVATK